MAEPALRADVIAALKAQISISVEVFADGSVEVAKDGSIRRFPFRETVSRSMLDKLNRWYGVPLAKFFPASSFRPTSEAAGE